MFDVAFKIGLNGEKPDFDAAKAQTRLRIYTVWSAPLIFAFHKVQ